jgi:hypothetical protein
LACSRAMRIGRGRSGIGGEDFSRAMASTARVSFAVRR